MAESVRAEAVQRAFARVAERRVAQIVSERGGFGQIFVEPQRTRQCPRNLRDLQRMGQTRAVMVALRREENLHLMHQPPEGLGMDDPVAVAHKIGTNGAGAQRLEPSRRIFG